MIQSADKGKRIIIIDFTNYQDYPIGGYLSFARSLMDSFKTDLALVGITTCKDDPVGKWFKKNIDGSFYDFFAMARYDKAKTRHLVPDRLVNYLLLKFYLNRIMGIRINNIFLQRQELLIALSPKSHNICYSFGGLENPLAISKYSYASYLSKWFEGVFFKKLKYAKTILARGDETAIREMIKRSKGEVDELLVTKFPTRINTEIFRPLNRIEVREKMRLPMTSTIVVTTGRLANFKGWKFMIDCFKIFEKEFPDCRFYFIGEGEDYEKIMTYISLHNLTDKIVLEGKKQPHEIALFLNAADLYIMGSYKEGWSTSLMEAIACGLPACVTNFSSANDIIIESENGFVVNDHNEVLFVQNMKKALTIPRPVKNDNVLRYSSSGLKNDLLKNWQLT